MTVASRRFLGGKRFILPNGIVGNSVTKPSSAVVVPSRRWKSTKPPTIPPPIVNDPIATTTIVDQTMTTATPPPLDLPPTSPPPFTPLAPAPPPSSTGRNLALATLLVGFVAGVFAYSMDSVGNANSNSVVGDGKSDPLARLKAEAKEAQHELVKKNANLLSPKQIQELEQGMAVEYDNAKSHLSPTVVQTLATEQVKQDLFMKDEATTKKNKPWWRFGF